jgi:tetratricopeptide (TPR) repeat protein
MEAAVEIEQPDFTSVLERIYAPAGPSFSQLEVDGLYAIGRLFYDREDYARSADVFRLLCLTAPSSARSWLALAACHEAVGDEERALRLYVIAAESDRSNEAATALLYAARLHDRRGENDELNEIIDHFDERFGETAEPSLLSLRGRLHARRQR